MVGKNEAIVELLTRLVNKYPELMAQGTCLLEEIPSLCHSNTFDVLLLSSGLSLDQENQISNTMTQLNPKLKTIEHFGGGSGLLLSELNQALGIPLG